jgi:hypothetical protein
MISTRSATGGRQRENYILVPASKADAQSVVLPREEAHCSVRRAQQMAIITPNMLNDGTNEGKVALSPIAKANNINYYH